MRGVVRRVRGRDLAGYFEEFEGSIHQQVLFKSTRRHGAGKSSRHPRKVVRAIFVDLNLAYQPSGGGHSSQDSAGCAFWSWRVGALRWCAVAHTMGLTSIASSTIYWWWCCTGLRSLADRSGRCQRARATHEIPPFSIAGYWHDRISRRSWKSPAAQRLLAPLREYALTPSYAAPRSAGRQHPSIAALAGYQSFREVIDLDSAGNLSSDGDGSPRQSGAVSGVQRIRHPRERAQPRTITMAGILRGKSLIVTGAGGGIGRAACLVLSEAGAKVLVTDINEEAGNGTVAAVSASGGTAAFVKADLARESDVQALVAKAVSTYGRLDGAFNNAGSNSAVVLCTNWTTDNGNSTSADWTRRSVHWATAIAMLSRAAGISSTRLPRVRYVVIKNAGEWRLPTSTGSSGSRRRRRTTAGTG